jgi:hypothetical protein
MIQTKMRRTSLWMVGALCLVGLGYRLGKAYASGIPTTNPLVYTGTFQNNGSAVTGTYPVIVSLYANSAGTGTPACTAQGGPVSTTFDSTGRFQVPIDPSCVLAINANPDLWVQLEVSINGSTPTLPLTHLGAVPYAVETNHAVTASNAADTLLAQVTRPAIPGVDGGPAYSLMAVYRATTSANFDGAQVGGYVGAKATCVALVGSPTAHMCTNEEVTRSMQIGLLPAEAGWISHGLGFIGQTTSDTSTALDDDCDSWTGNENTRAGALWGNNGSDRANFTCDNSYPIQCCD